MLPTSPRERVVKRARWLLLLPPCLPGVMMLLCAFFTAPLIPMPDVFTPTGEHDSRARQKAGELYVAGTVALLGGTLMSGFIAWKILRPPQPDDDESSAESPPTP